MQRVDLAEHHVGIRDGRLFAAATVAGRSRLCSAESGPTVMRLSESTRAMEPPPAPISTISITGMRTGMPEPFRNRAARSTSKVRPLNGV